jgi:hypothetical protein
MGAMGAAGRAARRVADTWWGRGKSGTLHRLDIEPGDRTRTQPSPRRTETGDTLSGTLAPAPAGPPGGPGIAAWAGPARPKDETSNELTLITNITDEAY